MLKTLNDVAAIIFMGLDPSRYRVPPYRLATKSTKATKALQPDSLTKLQLCRLISSDGESISQQSLYLSDSRLAKFQATGLELLLPHHFFRKSLIVSGPLEPGTIPTNNSLVVRFPDEETMRLWSVFLKTQACQSYIFDQLSRPIKFATKPRQTTNRSLSLTALRNLPAPTNAELEECRRLELIADDLRLDLRRAQGEVEDFATKLFDQGGRE